MRAALLDHYADCLCATCLRALSADVNSDVQAMTLVDLLMIQFLHWVAERPRTYADVMEAWRTSCPRQSVWEDAQIDGLVQTDGQSVRLTARGANQLSSVPAGALIDVVEDAER